MPIDLSPFEDLTQLRQSFIPRTSQLLELAADLLDRPNGWVQRLLWDNAGGFCAVGAIVEVLRRFGMEQPTPTKPLDASSPYFPTYQSACKALVRQLPIWPTTWSKPGEDVAEVILNYPNSVANWNDRPDMCQQRVVMAFRHAAKTEAELEQKLFADPAQPITIEEYDLTTCQ